MARLRQKMNLSAATTLRTPLVPTCIRSRRGIFGGPISWSRPIFAQYQVHLFRNSELFTKRAVWMSASTSEPRRSFLQALVRLCQLRDQLERRARLHLKDKADFQRLQQILVPHPNDENLSLGDPDRSDPGVQQVVCAIKQLWSGAAMRKGASSLGAGQ